MVHCGSIPACPAHSQGRENPRGAQRGDKPGTWGDPAHRPGSTTHRRGCETHLRSHKTLQEREAGAVTLPGHPGPPSPAPQGHCGAQPSPCTLHRCPCGGSSMGTDPTCGPTVGDTGPQAAQTHVDVPPPPHDGQDRPQPQLPSPSWAQPSPRVPPAPRGPCATHHMWGSSRSCLRSGPQPRRAAQTCP